MVELYPHQVDAVEALCNGSVLWGGVGSGKSRTSLAYYMKREAPRDLYVITTAKKRDSLDWVGEAAAFAIGRKPDETVAGVLTVDSWNNIGKYVNVKNAFFIFDEQRLVGSGAWVRSFYKIAEKNHWIILSATPGDTWMDYIPVFVANGFYKNRTEFIRSHVIYNSFTKYPKIDRYVGVGALNKLRSKVLVHMPYRSHHEPVDVILPVDYDRDLYKKVVQDRWNIYEDKPIETVSELFHIARRVINSDASRLAILGQLLEKHKKFIVFYTFNYELEALRNYAKRASETFDDFEVSEWNGHRHDPIPMSKHWMYLVQYASGSEGWNCCESDAICFYSLTYSYKMYAQAKGRIDRISCKKRELYYYTLQSRADLDLAVWRSLQSKKTFNESDFKF